QRIAELRARLALEQTENRPHVQKRRLVVFALVTSGIAALAAGLAEIVSTVAAGGTLTSDTFNGYLTMLGPLLLMAAVFVSALKPPRDTRRTEREIAILEGEPTQIEHALALALSGQPYA